MEVCIGRIGRLFQGAGRPSFISTFNCDFICYHLLFCTILGTNFCNLKHRSDKFSRFNKQTPMVQSDRQAKYTRENICTSSLTLFHVNEWYKSLVLNLKKFENY